MEKFWNCYWRYQEGEYHRSKKMKCQDRIAYIERGGMQAIAMVDGVGETDWNPIAGEMIANLVAEFMTDHFADVLYEMKACVGRILMKQIYDVIFSMMNHCCQPAKEFNFTLLGACINHEKGTYCTIHLGDGAVVCGGEKQRIISHPFNGTNENETCLVLSDQVLKYIKFHVGKTDDVQYLALCTDGVYGNRNQLQRVFDKIHDLRKGREISADSDDMGIIMLERR